MTLLADLEEFVADHRPHGLLIGDATEPALNGYLLTVACACGVVFERWVTPLDAELDLLRAGVAELTSRPKRTTSAERDSTPVQCATERPLLARACPQARRPFMLGGRSLRYCP